MVGIVHTPAMAVERTGVLPLLKAVIEIWRQTEAGVDPLALQLLRYHGPHRGAEPPETDDVEFGAIALRVDPESRTVFLPALLAENVVALFGGEFQRVVLLEEVLHRVDVGTQRRIIG